jgi:hypothetical protein
MSKPQCKSKKTFHTEEECSMFAVSGVKPYLCGSCNYWHLTSKGEGRKTDWKQKYKKRKKT